jgi:tetratricopeptide (TPR) repeat protein
MKKLELQREVSEFKQLFKTFESLLERRRRLCMANDQMAIRLCEFYAIWSACQIRRCIGSTWDFETVPSHEENEASMDFGEKFRKPETVHKAAQDLLAAVASEDKAAIPGALKEMGVIALCPAPEQVFSRMEDVTSRVTGLAQQVFLVDLALLAAGVGDFLRAGEYIQQARAFDPSSRELYNIHAIEGLIALNDGRVDEAIRSLENSTKACQTDVDSSIQCSLLPPNLELPERLLELGERTVVSGYLRECHNVWQLHRPQIEEWIRLIETGDKPDFQITRVVGTEDSSSPSYRLSMQWMRALSFEMQRSPAKPKASMSPTQILAERERMLAQHEPRMSAFVKKELEYLEKDTAISPDSPSSNPAA